MRGGGGEKPSSGAGGSGGGGSAGGTGGGEGGGGEGGGEGGGGDGGGGDGGGGDGGGGDGATTSSVVALAVGALARVTCPSNQEVPISAVEVEVMAATEASAAVLFEKKSRASTRTLPSLTTSARSSANGNWRRRPLRKAVRLKSATSPASVNEARTTDK